MSRNPHRQPDGRAARHKALGIDLDADTRRVLRDYADHCRRRGLRDASLDRFQRVLILVAEHVHPRPLLAMTGDDLERFLDARRLTARTRYSYISIVHGFYEWGTTYDLTDRDPTARVARPRYPNSIPRPIPDADLEHAFAIAAPRERAVMAFAAFHGLRAGEIAGLQREDILDRNTPPVIIVTNGKGGRQRVLPLHTDAWHLIEPWIADHRTGYVFTDEDTGRAVPAWRVSHWIADLLHGAGIASSLHALRHYYGTKVYAASRDLRVTQALLGHASPNTTVGYVAWSAIDAHHAVNALTVPHL